MLGIFAICATSSNSQSPAAALSTCTPSRRTERINAPMELVTLLYPQLLHVLPDNLMIAGEAREVFVFAAQLAHHAAPHRISKRSQWHRDGLRHHRERCHVIGLAQVPHVPLQLGMQLLACPARVARDTFDAGRGSRSAT
jgi:hypothetical protein